MKIHHPHGWNVSFAEARRIQEALKQYVELDDRLPEINTVAGIDVGMEPGSGRNRAAVALLDFPSLAVREQTTASVVPVFPYVPGLLSFREIPAILEAMSRLSSLPDLILCDGQGYAHPRRFGLACHLGVLTDCPTIGVAKTRLIGDFEPPACERGNHSELIHQGEVVGRVLRTRTGVKPLFVSSGHRIGLNTAVDFVMACTTRYRLPETTRRAHRLVSAR